MATFVKHLAANFRLLLRQRLWTVPLLFTLSPILAASLEEPMQNPYKVQAAFLRNFAHYVTWPNQALAEDGTSWRIGILGKDPFGDTLEATFKGRMEQGRSFEIVRANSIDELPPCHIVYLATPDPGQRRAALAKLKDKPTLTVSAEPSFLNEGGIIQFQVTDKVRMSINLDQAQSASLTIQTKMLEVSSGILQNGTIRQAR